MKKTDYQLTHRITGHPLPWGPFRTPWQAARFALEHDLHATVAQLGALPQTPVLSAGQAREELLEAGAA